MFIESLQLHKVRIFSIVFSQMTDATFTPVYPILADLEHCSSTKIVLFLDTIDSGHIH